MWMDRDWPEAGTGDGGFLPRVNFSVMKKLR